MHGRHLRTHDITHAKAPLGRTGGVHVRCIPCQRSHCSAALPRADVDEAKHSQPGEREGRGLRNGVERLRKCEHSRRLRTAVCKLGVLEGIFLNVYAGSVVVSDCGREHCSRRDRTHELPIKHYSQAVSSAEDKETRKKEILSFVRPNFRTFLDRLTHRCHILETKGESFRLAEAKKRRSKRAYAENLLPAHPTATRNVPQETRIQPAPQSSAAPRRSFQPPSTLVPEQCPACCLR